MKKDGHWPQIARMWEQVGAPLRPSPEDLKFINETVSAWAIANGSPRALILGVTPEFYSLPWPSGTPLLALDHTQGMIDAIWPGARDSALCSDWIHVPPQAGPRDIVLCDGGIHLLAYPEKSRRLIRSLQRVVPPGGLCIFRLFVPPPKRETPEQVLADLFARKIPNLNILKLRLAMAMQEDARRGVELKKVWNKLHEAAPDFTRLAADIGWPLDHLLVINTYRDSSNRYYFLSVADVRQLFCEEPGGFELKRVYEPAYDLGERCPTVVFQRRDGKPR